MLTASFHLTCSVRECGLPLVRRPRVFACAEGHAYDVAQSGYVNLLQPHDRRSLLAGDSKAAVKARARLVEAGIGRAIADEIVRRAAAMDLVELAPVVDLGSGTGDTLAQLAATRPLTAVGIDLSTAAAEHAARRFPTLTWVVANADRRLPLVDRSVQLVLSLHGRRNPAECARVVAPNGWLLVAVPAPDDVIELREAVQGQALERERADTLVPAHEPYFTLLDRFSVRARHHLAREALLDLLRTTYRGERMSGAGRVAAMTSLEVTLASDVFLFAPR